VTGATFADGAWEPAAIAAFVAGLGGSIAMWWIYFNAHADAAAGAIEASDDPGRIARHAYTYAHIPIVAGIIVTAAGDELAVAHPLGHVEGATLALIVGGPALFLAGGLWFKHSVFKVLSASRGAGLGMLAALALAAPQLTPLVLSAAATAILALVAAWETVSRPQGVAELQARG
jgi:low temperature requirement protein LtrA